MSAQHSGINYENVQLFKTVHFTNNHNATTEAIIVLNYLWNVNKL